jgi:hypothetical protein
VTLPQDIDSLKFSEIVKLVKTLEDEKIDGVPLKIAFLRNITLDLIIPYLKLYSFQEGLKAEIHMGGYDNAMQEAISTTIKTSTPSPGRWSIKRATYIKCGIATAAGPVPTGPAMRSPGTG